MSKSFFEKKLGFCTLCVLCLTFFVSCAGSPKFEGSATVTGIIVDESNQPVSGFPVTVSSKIRKFGTSVTNANGIFFVQNVDSGKIIISGKKEGYAILDCEETFYQRDEIFCFQISSIDAVLDRVEEKILQEDYEKGIELLKTVYSQKKSPVYDVVQEYKNFCNRFQSSNKETEDELSGEDL